MSKKFHILWYLFENEPMQIQKFSTKFQINFPGNWTKILIEMLVTGSCDFLKAASLWKYSFSNENKVKNVYI